MKPCQKISECPSAPSDSPEAYSDLLTLSAFIHLRVCVLSSQHILIVQRQLSVLEEELEEFRLALRQYMEFACAQTGCLQSVHIIFVHVVSKIYSDILYCLLFL